MKSFKLIILTVFTFFSITSFGQDSTKHKMTRIVYICTMHPEIKSDKPGKCPKCGMDLVQKKTKAEVKKTFTCSMHPEINSDKPGKCPKCGMDLIERKAASKTKTS